MKRLAVVSAIAMLALPVLVTAPASGATGLQTSPPASEISSSQTAAFGSVPTRFAPPCSYLTRVWCRFWLL